MQQEGHLPTNYLQESYRFTFGTHWTSSRTVDCRRSVKFGAVSNILFWKYS